VTHKRSRAAAAAAILALAVAALAVRGLISPTVRPAPPETAPPEATGERLGRVSYVYDGDTVEVAGLRKVRLIGIDAMDAYDAVKAKQQAQDYGMSPDRVRHWAQEATRFARARLQGRTLVIVSGGRAVDDYGRTLAYLETRQRETADREDFGLLMLQSGLAVAYRRFDHPRREAYLTAERQAQAQRLGLWQEARPRH
jgi:micrococcal nuclease